MGISHEKGTESEALGKSGGLAERKSYGHAIRLFSGLISLNYNLGDLTLRFIVQSHYQSPITDTAHIVYSDHRFHG